MIARATAIGMLAAMLVALAPAVAHAQARPARPAPQPRTPTLFRGFGDLGMTIFSATDSFDAVLDTHNGLVFGGGGEVVFPQRIFVNARISRFQKDGTRVFILNNEIFDLGIDTKVSVTPFEITAGYRLQPWSRNLVGYGGGGIGWHMYKETSEFANATDDVSETHVGYHLLGGAEYRVARRVGVAGEFQWTTVPDALGQDPNGVSAFYDETNLGGISFRVKVVVGGF